MGMGAEERSNILVSMVKISEEIISMDMKNEDSAEKLLKLQLEHLNLQNQLSLQSDISWSDDDYIIIRECLQLENEANKAIQSELTILRQHINQASKVKKARSMYLSDIPQVEGYFIDRQR
ncbi:hypothetical protein ACFO9Q_13505 [Paenibacillus sp. GCM10023252]|uniref:hypothetical protein n=1 Tax=Paenibacillus sp. GCM10023252 TaxID=3252649 RepID=UPI00361CAA3A